ncbi:MAG: 50S ribosomal protein L11 methyltransferase [Chloroflexota bacterium]|nr:50S ribosomal protein L11 methyltransferase [Chloroflexota bacterium]
MSSWIEVSLCADGESAEAIAEVLERFGHQGVSLEQTGIAPDKWDESEVPPGRRFRLRAYFPADERAESTKKELETALGRMRLMYPMPQPSYKTLDAEDWAEAWKAHYQPLRVGQRLLIRPLWIDVASAPGEIEIALDPGMAFGTGTHPTTQLCLEALERLIGPAQDLLDLGSGSGILSIAAAKLGARNVLALDIDPIAVAATAGNARANGVEDKIIAGQGSLETVSHSARRFDVIVVNILARVILQLTTEGLGEILRPGGLAIFSGIIDEQLDEVETALSRSGLQPYARHQRGDWLLVEAKRAAD